MAKKWSKFEIKTPLFLENRSEYRAVTCIFEISSSSPFRQCAAFRSKEKKNSNLSFEGPKNGVMYVVYYTI